MESYVCRAGLLLLLMALSVDRVEQDAGQEIVDFVVFVIGGVLWLYPRVVGDILAAIRKE